jgi:type IV pilus assembly protein PilM
MKDLKQLFKKNLESLKRYLPQEKPRINIGLDIGTSSVKAVALRMQKDKIELVNFILRQKNNKSNGEVVKEVLEDLNIENKNINISVAGQGVVVRSMQLPMMSISEAKKAVGFEAEKHIPFTIDEVFLDCFMLKQLPQENKMLILLAAAKKDLITQRLNLLKELGIVPHIIDVDSLALANVFNRQEIKKTISMQAENASSKSKKAIAILNLGASFSNLIIIERGLPKFIRDIFIGGNDLTKRISNILGLSIIEAEKTKCNPSTDWEKIINASQTVLNNLVNEIRRSFDYFESDSNTQIDSLYLSGGGSYFKGISEFFNAYLNVEIKTLYPFANLTIADDLDMGALKSQAQRLLVATGLALRLR